MWYVWLVWILRTKCKSLERVENFERCMIFSCYCMLIYSIHRVFILLCLLVIRFILQMALLSGYSSFQFVSALNSDCSFVFEWHNSVGVWKDAKIFVLWSVLVSIQFLLLKMWSYLLTCIEQWWWRSSVATFVLQLSFSQLWDRICLILLCCCDWQGVKYCFGR